MKTLTFSDNKRPILTFEAETLEYQAEGTNATTGTPEILIVASGEITFQDTPPLEEMLGGDYEYLLTVTEGANELMCQRFHVLFLLLEPEQLAVRIW